MDGMDDGTSCKIWKPNQAQNVTITERINFKN